MSHNYEKLERKVTEVNYLRAENYKRYRRIIRYFYEEYEKIHYLLYKEDVFQMMQSTGLFPGYTMEECLSDLEALTDWKNLIATQDTSRVLTLEEYKNRKYRYQLSEYSVEIERMTLKLENLEIEGASLEPTLLERIHRNILKIDEMKQKSGQEASIWWNDLNNDFIRLNRSYQDYIGTFNSAKAEEMMKTTQFLVFKEKIIQYLRSFVKELQEQAVVLEDYIASIKYEEIGELINKISKYECEIPRIDRKINFEELYENNMGRWGSLYHWFVSDETESEVNRMSDITLDIIRKITRYAQQIGELYNFGTNRKEEYRHIANIFGQCETLQDAHKLSAHVFGVDTTFHLKEMNQRNTDSIESGVYDEKPTETGLEPRSRIRTIKSKRIPPVEYQIEKLIQKQEILEKQERDQKLLESYIVNHKIEFSKLKYIDAYSRKIMLSWLSRGLADAQHRGRTEWGTYYTIQNFEESTCTIACEDGELTMPTFCICFEEDKL